MALSNEDKKDVARHFGKSTANKVAKSTYDADAWSKKNLGRPSRAVGRALAKRAGAKNEKPSDWKKYYKANPSFSKSQLKSIKEQVDDERGSWDDD